MVELDSYNLSQFERRLAEQSPILHRLLTTKRIYHDSPGVDKKFERNRKSLELPHSQVFMNQFSYTFNLFNDEMDGIFDNNRVKRFVDLGCAPGGFSKWLLEHNPKAFGIGVTFPEGEGLGIDVRGTPMEGLERYGLHYGDVTQISPMSALLNTSVSNDLIIAGAFPTGQCVSQLDRQVLLLSQVLLVMLNLEDGGSSVVVVNTKPLPWIVEVIEMLRSVFSSVKAVKSKTLHATRSSCYLICTGFDAGSDRKTVCIDQIRRLLNSRGELETPLDGGMGEERCLLSDESHDELYERAHTIFLEFFEPIWTIQLEALENEMTRFKNSAHTAPWKKTFLISPASSVDSSQDWRLRNSTQRQSTFSNIMAPRRFRQRQRLLS